MCRPRTQQFRAPPVSELLCFQCRYQVRADQFEPGFVGERIWTVTLKPGKYTYWCDPHSSMMHGSFRVVASSS